jgi:hypothetical protein
MLSSHVKFHLLPGNRLLPFRVTLMLTGMGRRLNLLVPGITLWVTEPLKVKLTMEDGSNKVVMEDGNNQTTIMEGSNPAIMADGNNRTTAVGISPLRMRDGVKITIIVTGESKKVTIQVTFKGMAKVMDRITDLEITTTTVGDRIMI